MMSQKLLVSPYLETFPSWLEILAERITDRRDTMLLAEARITQDAVFVFDCLTNSLSAITRNDRDLLIRLRGIPFALQDIDDQSVGAIERLQEAGLVLDEEDAFRVHRYDRVPIEINSHCNFRCQFCPVATDPLPKRFMAEDLYRTVLKRVVEANISRIALNHYGEPSLDPNLVKRVQLAKEAGLQVDLFSNASGLDASKLGDLAQLGNVNLVVNLPTINAEEYHQYTGWKNVDRVCKNLRHAVDLGMNVSVTVNAPKSLTEWERRRLLHQIRKRTGVEATLAFVQSRGGAMANESYVSPTYHSGKLSGCYRMLTKVVVNVDAMAFLCCQDYRQEYILGDLRTSTLSEIAASDRATQIRRWVFGSEEPPDDFICRRCEETASRDRFKDQLVVGSSWLGNTLHSVGFRSALPS